MHLGHVGAPEHEGVGLLDVVVAAHGLIHAEGAHETDHGGGHAVTGVGIQVVGAQARLHQLGGGIAFPDGPLAGAEHADRGRSLLLEGGLELLGHDVERLIPADGGEVAILVELAIGHAQHGLGQAILAVHDLGEEVALDAVEATVDRRIGIALGRHDAAGLGAHQHGAAGAAEAAGRLVPGDGSLVGAGNKVRRQGGGTDSGHGSGCRHRIGLHKVASTQLHDISSHCLITSMTAIVTSRAGSASWRFIAIHRASQTARPSLVALFPALGFDFIKLVVDQGGGENARHGIDRIDGRHDGALAGPFQGHHQLAFVADGMDLGSVQGRNLFCEPVAQGGLGQYHQAGYMELFSGHMVVFQLAHPLLHVADP
ncbi:hypothetical protein D3C76_523610 [compost metagenome]